MLNVAQSLHFETGVDPSIGLAGHLILKVCKMKSIFMQFIRDESGASAAEYALILAIVGAGIAVAAGALGTAVSTAINSATTAI